MTDLSNSICWHIYVVTLQIANSDFREGGCGGMRAISDFLTARVKLYSELKATKTTK